MQSAPAIPESTVGGTLYQCILNFWEPSPGRLLEAETGLNLGSLWPELRRVPIKPNNGWLSPDSGGANCFEAGNVIAPDAAVILWT